MTETLKTELELEYGNLLQQLENTFDWDLKRKLIIKLNQINNLLDLFKIEKPNIYNKLKKTFL